MDISIMFIFLTLLFSTLCQNTNAACPFNCECKRAYYYTIIITCHNISSIPENIPRLTIKMFLAGNDIQLLKPGVFKGLDNLNEIQLQGNKIRLIEKGVFVDAVNLEYLNMSLNAIQAIEPGSFNHSKNIMENLDLSVNVINVLKRNTFIGAVWLKHLDLSQNRIEIMEAGTFTGLQSLTILSLVHNKLQKLQYGVFTGLSSVYILDLQGNSIAFIDDGVFDEQSELSSLHLGYNKIQMIQTGTFRGLHSLKNLYLKHNKIETVRPGLFKLHTLRVLVLDFNEVTTLYNGAFNNTKLLIYLYLKGNQLKEIQSRAFEGLQILQSLHFTKSGLKRIAETSFQGTPDVSNLMLDGNYIETLEPGTFNGLSNLYYLSIANNMITGLPGSIFNGSKNVEYIFIQNNKLHAIEQGTFEGMGKLRELNLSYNQLEWIKGYEFLTLHSLTYLDLNKNKIKYIEPGAFKDLQALIDLYLNNNNLTVLPDGLFTKMKKLRGLYISESNVKKVVPGALGELTALKYLHLNKNKITRLTRGIFNGARHLDMLDFSDNAINVIEESTFDEMQTLTKIFLQNNNITYIRKGVFNNTGKVKIINVSRNSIEMLENGTFHAMDKLKQLDLSRNEIQHIKEGVFDELIDLENLYLGSNRIPRIEKEWFNKTTSLLNLYLQNNLIENIEVGTFTQITSYTINLINNNLRRIEEGIFTNNAKLHTLKLKENKIETIEPGAFKNLISLTNVELDGNKLTDLDNRTFLNLRSLFSLSLSRNRLKFLPDGFFTGLTHLTTLVIYENEFTTIPRFDEGHLNNLFFGSNLIKTLDNLKLMRNISELINVFFDNNRIERILNDTFKGATKLIAISLTGNPLRVIEDGAFLSLPSLKIINLLDTQLTVPLNIWPTKTLITFIVLQSRASTNDIVIRGQNTNSRLVLITVGYICRDVAFDTYDCEPCNRGSFKSPSRQACELCPPGGFYQDEMGYSTIIEHNLGCKQCPPGSYVKPELAPGKSQTECQSCPPGTNLKQYAKFRACRCMENYYRLRRFGPCSICTKGNVCLNETIDLAPGFYWMWQSKRSQQQYEDFKNDLMITTAEYKINTFEENIPNVYACPVAESCLGKSHSECSEGYEGPLCAVCGKGYFNVLTKCRECPTLPWIIGQIVVASLGMTFLIVIVLREKKKDPDNPTRTLTDIFLARLKIVIGFYQVSVATFDSFSYISWPGPVVSIMKYAKMVQFNLLLIAPVNCINHSIRADAYTQLLLSVVITGLVILIGPLFNFLAKMYVKCKIKGKENQEMQLREYKEKSYRFLILILFITFPSTCTHIIQMLPAACQEICSYGNVLCNSYLKADYSIKCNTAKHSIYGNFGSVALIYCIGFPMSIFALLKYARRNAGVDKENKNIILAGTRFLYENYSLDCWFWEIVELVRKIVVTSMLILMNAESRTSLGLTAILSGLYSVGFAYSKPIKDAFEHWLQLTSLMASSVNFTIGMLMKIPEEESSSGIDNQTDTFIVTAFLVAANVLVIALVAVQYLSKALAKILALKENPECSASCCLEILQLVSEVPGEVTNVSAPAPPTESQDLFQNATEAKNQANLNNNIHGPVKDVPKKI